MRRFALSRRFSLLSLILVTLAAAALLFLVHRHEIQQLQSQAEEQNVRMSRVILLVLAGDVDTLLERSDAQSADTIRLSSKIEGLMPGSGIVKLKLYDFRGRTIYSTDAKQIGEEKGGNGGFRAAMKGLVVSELTRRHEFSAFEGVLQDVSLVSSYVPVMVEGRSIAVFELYQDVTALDERLTHGVWRLSFLVAFILGCLYFVQLLVYRHAQQLVNEQKALLEQANRDLDWRIAERTQELEKREARISELLREQQLIFDNAHVGILLLQQRKILKSNQRIAEMFGYDDPSAFEGRTTEMLYPSHEDFKRAGEEGYSQLAAKGHAHFEVEMQRRDGSRIWVIQAGRSLDPVAVFDSPSIWVYTDISERKQAEVELGIAAAAFESQESMIVTDADTVILRVNKAFTESTGYSASELIGRKPNLLRSGHHDDAFYAAMWNSIIHGGSWQGEIWDRRKNGEIYPKWLNISAVTDKQGKVTHYVGTHTDITERKQAEERIQHLAFFDQLTNLPNRTLLQDRLRQAMLASARNRRHGALVFLDLDHFKALNDTLGHDYGDMLLKEVANILLANVRQGDTVARLGGDEFVVVLVGLEENVGEAARHVEAICRKLLAALKQDYRLGGTEFHGSASLGATLFCGQETPIEELLKQADLAMYKSKEAGRNAFTFFDPVMEESVLALTQIEADLRRAIQEQQLALYYQPLLAGHSQRIVGAEALLRWLHPVRGMVPPDAFIGVAESSGLIVPIGLWVLRTACRQLVAWAGQPDKSELSISVNVSVQQFRQASFVDDVLAILAETGARADRLKLEITESVFVEEVEDVIAKMLSLKTTGVGFSLDDFGTGYSSLSYLSRLPLDQLKIDRSFVADLEAGDNKLLICTATISLAHSLKLKVVAEGVENQIQHYILTQVHHCDLLQGYFYGRPMPIDAFEAHLAAQPGERSRRRS